MVKIFKDGERLTAVFYDCSPETQSLIVKLIQEAGEEVPKTIPVPEVSPAKGIKEPGVVVTDLQKLREKEYNTSMKIPTTMPYSGMTIKQALQKDGIFALIQIDLNINLLDKKKDRILLNTIQKEFHGFAEKDFNQRIESIEDTDLDEMRNYIINLEDVLPEVINEILQKQTYPSVDVFALSASEKEIKQAYASLSKALVKKY